MLTKNDTNKVFVNGTLWNIKSIKDGIIEIITDENIIISISKESWISEIYEFIYDQTLWKIRRRIKWKIIQYPIRLAWAMTIHKSQWLTYDKVSINFWEWCFAEWQTYVALSRCRSFKWIHFQNELTPKSIIINEKVNDFFKNNIDKNNSINFWKLWIKIDDWRIKSMFENKWWIDYFTWAKSIIKKINSEWWKAFIVWWFCRNRILNISIPTDIDISTDFIPENIEKYFTVVNRIWEDFWVLIIKEFWYTYEISTFRKDITKHQVEFIKKFSEDANRRDFTINAIYLDPILDKYQIFNKKIWINRYSIQDWIEDLKNKIIRFIWNPEKRIKEDPLRLIRYIRFKSQFDLSDAYDEQFDIVKNNFKLIKKIPFERIKVEIEKIFSWNGTIKALKMLKELWFFALFIPEIDNLDKCPWWAKYHLEWDVWVHTLMIIENLKSRWIIDPDIYWASLFHDTWKLDTYKQKDDWTISYIWHEDLSEKIFMSYRKDLKFTKNQIDKIGFIIKNHLLFGRILDMKQLKARKLFLHEYWNDFFVFCSADNLWRIPAQQDITEKIIVLYDDFMGKYDESKLFTWEDIMEKYPELNWREIWDRLKELNDNIIANM